MNEKNHLGDAEKNAEIEMGLSCLTPGIWPDNIDFDGSDGELEAFYDHAEHCPYHSAIMEQSNSSFATMIREVQGYLETDHSLDSPATASESSQEMKLGEVLQAVIIISTGSLSYSTLRLAEKRRFCSRGIYEVGCILDNRGSYEEKVFIRSLDDTLTTSGGRVLGKKDECEPDGARLILFRFAGTEKTLSGVESFMQGPDASLGYHWLDAVESGLAMLYDAGSFEGILGPRMTLDFKPEKCLLGSGDDYSRFPLTAFKGFLGWSKPPITADQIHDDSHDPTENIGNNKHD